MQLVTHARLTKIYNKNINTLKKYNRKYIFIIFDAFYSKSEFQNIFINDFFKRIISRSLKYKKRPKFNINENSNKSIEKLKIDKIKSNVNNN